MTETITVAWALERSALKLDAVTRELYDATDAQEKAEEVWDEKYDELAEELTQELRDAESTRDPAEHAVTSAARRRYRQEYHDLRRAERRMKRAQTMSSNRRTQTSAYQTMFNNMGAEAEVQDYLSQRDPELLVA